MNRGGSVVHCNAPQPAILAERHGAETGFADAGCIFQHGLEHGLQLAWRTGNNAQHLRCGGLLLQRLAQFVEQPRVLDSDHRLGGEILHQRGLLVGEGAQFLSIDADGADQLVVLKQRHGEQGSNSAEIDRRNPHRIARCIAWIRVSDFDLDNPLCCDSAAETRIRARMNELVQPRFDIGRRRAVHGSGTEAIAFAEVHRAEFGLADARGILQHGLKNRLQLAGGCADDLEYIGRRRLLL